MIISQLELTSKFRLMCEGGYNNSIKHGWMGPPCTSETTKNKDLRTGRIQAQAMRLAGLHGVLMVCLSPSN